MSSLSLGHLTTQLLLPFIPPPETARSTSLPSSPALFAKKFVPSYAPKDERCSGHSFPGFDQEIARLLAYLLAQFHLRNSIVEFLLKDPEARYSQQLGINSNLKEWVVVEAFPRDIRNSMIGATSIEPHIVNLNSFILPHCRLGQYCYIQ